MTDNQLIFLAIFIAVNLCSFLLMMIDKARAKKGQYRISEKALFIVAFFGGIGGCAGMWTFRHKTQHWYFVVFFALFALLSLVALYFGLSWLA